MGGNPKGMKFTTRMYQAAPGDRVVEFRDPEGIRFAVRIPLKVILRRQ